MKIHYGNIHLKSPKLLFSLMMYMFFFLLIPFASLASFHNITFDFQSFGPNMNDIKYEGDAYPSNPVIQLTINQRDKGLNGSAGRATYKEPMHLWDNVTRNLADFSTRFSFAIHSQGNDSYGDGLAFFLAPNGSQLLNFTGGGNLGLFSSHQKLDFVAVEFDTFNNSWDPTVYLEHIGIDINSMQSVNTVGWNWSDIKNGKIVDAWISYNASLKILSAFITGDYEGPNYGNFSSTSYIVDLRDVLPQWVTFGFSATTGSLFEIHNIYSWEFSSSLQVDDTVTNQTSQSTGSVGVSPFPSPVIPRKRNSGTWLWVVLGGCGLVILVSGSVWFCCWMKKNRRKREDDPPLPLDEEFENVRGPRKFLYNELVLATNNFSNTNLLGEGGFGKVYKGVLNDTNSIVAVKRITPESVQGKKEYASEVNTISRLRHRNLVHLVGWCSERGESFIIYEFMPNKSLDLYLFKKPGTLTWERRYGIALGLASALFYLQEECEQCVLHRDIKSSNVLLDLNFNAKLGDFGLARLVDHGQGSRTTDLIGTVGYMAPEYLESSHPSKESDVYSFGIVALEIACGKRAIEGVDDNGKRFIIKLVEQVWMQYGSGNIFDAADPSLGQDYDKKQMESLIVVGLSCAHPNHNERPSIRDAIDMLNFKIPLPVLPSKMPVPRYTVPLATLSELSRSLSGSSVSERGQTQFSGTSFNTNSSKVTTSSTASNTY